MATVAEQHAFLDDFTALAESAAQQLRINADIVLGQWALESAWGTDPEALTAHNVAGLTFGGHGLIPYPDYGHMVAAYVVTMRRDCPDIADGTVSPESTAAEVFARSSYNSADPTYVATIGAIAAEIPGLRQGPAPTPEPAPAPSVPTFQELATESAVAADSPWVVPQKLAVLLWDLGVR